MSGDRRGTDREPRPDFTSREFAALEILEDLTPGWVGKSPTYSGVVIHSLILATLLISINPTLEQPWLGAPCIDTRRNEVRFGRLCRSVIASAVGPIRPF